MSLEKPYGVARLFLKFAISPADDDVEPGRTIETSATTNAWLIFAIYDGRAKTRRLDEWLDLSSDRRYPQNTSWH